MRNRRWEFRAFCVVLLLAVMGLLSSCGCGDDDDDSGGSGDDTADDDTDDDADDDSDDDADDDVDDDADDDTDDDTSDEWDDIFSDDFESYTNGAPPTPTWQVFNDDGDVTVTEDWPWKEAGQFAWLTKYTAAVPATVMRVQFPESVFGVARISFDMIVNDVVGGAVKIWPHIDSTFNDPLLLYQMSYSPVDGVMTIDHTMTGPGTYISAPCPYATPMEWHRYDVYFDFTQQTSETYVDGNSCGAGIPFMNAGTAVEWLWFERTGATPPGDLAVDNVHVYKATGDF